MNKILKKSKLILIILVCFMAFVGFLNGIGLISNGSFSDVISGILYWATLPLLLVLLLISLLVNNQKGVNFLLCVLASYFVVGFVNDAGVTLSLLYKNAPATYVLEVIFSFIFYLSVAVVFILITLMVVFNLLGGLKKLLNIFCLICLGAGALAFIFEIVLYIDVGSDWISYVNAINTFIAVPCFLFIARNVLLETK